MSRESEALKYARNKTKEKMIEAMGGECQICGYNKCDNALAFHHINPDEKDTRFGLRPTASNWDFIINELRKCILLCHNCHTEVHGNVTNLPETYKTFNEEYAPYENFYKMDNCPQCNTLKPIQKQYCSRACAIVGSEKIDWDSIDLEKELKTKTMTQIGEEYNISRGSVARRKKKLSL